MTSQSPSLDLLRASVDRLRSLALALDDEQLTAQSYASEWRNCDVLSHLGSGAVIMRQRIDDAVDGRQLADSFAPAVWDAWNAKSPSVKRADALAADDALLECFESISADQRSTLLVAMGPMQFDCDTLIRLRLNEHVVHSWDISVVLDPSAVLAPDAVAQVVDSLELMGSRTARPNGLERTIRFATSDPSRAFVLRLAGDAATFGPDSGELAPDLTLPAESLVRLIYGRLDPAHTPATITTDGELLELLRRIYPGF